MINSSIIFQTMMNDIIHNLLADRIIIVYLDNILIFTQILENHQKVMCKVLKVLAKHKLFLCPRKCEFNKRQIKYLELVISENQVAIDLINLSVRVKDSRLTIFHFHFHFLLFLFWKLRVRISVMSHCHKWSHDQMSHWKNIEGSGKIILYSMYNIY